MENFQSIVSSSIDFLKKQALNPQSAYPSSTLPHSSELMRKALQFRVASLNRPEATQDDLQQMKVITTLYISLANYIEDKDAELVNQMDETFADLSRETDPHQFVEKDRRLMSEDSYQTYLAILEEIKGRRDKLREEIDPLISVEMAG